MAVYGHRFTQFRRDDEDGDMTIDLSAHLNKRTSLNVGRNLAIFFAFALSIAASSTPARALVPAAPAWALSAEINQLVIIKGGFRDTKKRRLARTGNCGSAEIDSETDCQILAWGEPPSGSNSIDWRRG
jgi:hypothetical protein